MSEAQTSQTPRIARPFWFALGWIAVALAAAGAVLPLLPTTPFLLVAVWAFGKSSERWRRWVYAQPHFGPLIVAWERHGAIPRWAKVLAISMMAASFLGLTLSDRLPWWGLGLVGVTLACVGIFIVTRPSRGPEQETEEAT